jgi:hypothetical protein
MIKAEALDGNRVNLKIAPCGQDEFRSDLERIRKIDKSNRKFNPRSNSWTISNARKYESLDFIKWALMDHRAQLRLPGV